MDLEQQKNAKGINSGFYYDQQLDNGLLVASLHPNTKFDKDKKEWVQADKPEEDVTPGETDFKYSKNPICSCLIPEDFQVTIANSWSDFGGDPLGELWNSMKPLAPYIDEVEKSVDTITNKTGEYVAENGGDGTIFTKLLRPISDFLGKAKDSGLLKKESQMLNRSLVTQGTRFSYYSGTGVDFGGNLVMKFTLFYGYKDGRFKTVQEQVEEILPYVVGEFKRVDEKEFSVIQEYASWQMPPGGFKSEIKDIDNICKGTLKLHIGNYYAIEDLVISNAQFSFSKIMAKMPERGCEGKFTPLYCDVILNLRPASRYSEKSLKRFISGEASKKRREALENKIKEDMMSFLYTDNYC